MSRGAGGPLGARFGVLLTSSASSNLADGMIKTALPLIAVRWTDSPALVIGIVAMSTLPWLLFALPAGWLVDVLDRRRAMIAANVLRAMSLLAVGGLIVSGEQSIWMLYVVAFFSGPPRRCMTRQRSLCCRMWSPPRSLNGPTADCRRQRPRPTSSLVHRWAACWSPVRSWSASWVPLACGSL